MENKLKLFIKSQNDKELDMDIPNPSEEVKHHAIVQAFALFGVNPPPAPAPEQPTPTPEPPKEKKVEAKVDVQAEPQTTYQAPPKPIVETKIRQHNDVYYGEPATMEEVAALAPPNAPEHVKTGIKMKQGKPAYRCRHVCPKCNSRGTHYVWQGTESVDCYNCQTTMQVRKAIRGTTLQPDKMGSFYVAGDIQPTVDVTYANQKEKINVLKQHNLLDKDYNGHV